MVPNSERPLPHGAELLVVKASGPRIAPKDIAEALFKRGLRKILVEGGATTVSHFVDAGIVDRIHILVAPMIMDPAYRACPCLQ